MRKRLGLCTLFGSVLTGLVGGLFFSPLPAALTIWTAAAYFLIGLAYLEIIPPPALKRPDGSIAFWSALPHLPYLFFSGLALFLFIRFGREPPFCEVVPGLYLGRRLTRRDAGPQPPPTGCLDLTLEMPSSARFRNGKADLKVLPLIDGTAPSPTQIEEATDWLRSREGKGPTYVHCAYGHGRSALMVAAYLWAAGVVEGPDEALEFLRRKRPSGSLKREQHAVLREWAERRTAK